MLRSAKLSLARSHRAVRLGEAEFEILSAYYQRNTHLLIGKLTYRVWGPERDTSV